MSRALSLALLIATISLTLPAQILYVPDSNPATGGGPNTIPWGQTGGYTSLHVYQASQLLAAGICGGAALTDFAIIAATTASGNYSCATARLQVGHLATYPPIQGNWAGHLVSPVTIWDTAANGLFTFPWVGNTWNSLPGFSAGNFVWDGVSDIGLLYTHTGATGTFSTRTSLNMRHGVTVYNATTNSPTTTGQFATKARLTFAGGTALYQVNQANASLDADGVAPLPCLPSTATKCGGALTTINFNSALAGSGWELAFTVPDLLLPLGGGATVLPGSGQLLNVNLASPGLYLLNGLAFPPFPGAFSLPLTAPAPLTVGAQMAVLDPTNPDFLALSGGVNLKYTAGGTSIVPFTTNTTVTYTLGVPPLCGPSSVTFFGASYTQLIVTDNGRVMFGGTSTSGAPTVALALANPGFVGHWCDLNPVLGGYIAVSTTATTVRVDWLGVPYAVQVAFPNTFGIEFNTVTNDIKIDGLAGIPLHPTATVNEFFGISRGLTATNGGAATFSPATAGITTNSTDMIYGFGRAGSFTSGLSSITFTPNSFGNYDWFTL